MKNYFHPKAWMAALDEIDQQHPSYSLGRQQALRRTLITLVVVCISLLFLHYTKYSSSFYILIDCLENGFDQPKGQWTAIIAATGWQRLIEYTWWTFCHLFAFLALPWIAIRFLLKEKFSNLGWRWQDTGQHWPGYICLLVPILCFVYIASLGDDFVNHYPFYKLANRSWADLLCWEILYLTQFICLEFFFRGFMIQSLRPALGANAIWIMCVPYMMIHLPKLWPEAMGAILFGFFLGILAFQSRSIWGGVFVHAGIALSMDIAALLRTAGLPNQWLP